MGSLKLPRTELAFLSLTPPKTLFRAQSFSHLRVVLSPAVQNPPPKPPDPPNPLTLWPNIHPMPLFPPSLPKLLRRSPSPASFPSSPPDSPRDQVVLPWSAAATCGSTGHAGDSGVRSLLPFLCSMAFPSPCLSEPLFWAWSYISLRGFCLFIPIEFCSLGTKFVHDISILPFHDGIPHDGVRDSSAELFSSPILGRCLTFHLWRLFSGGHLLGADVRSKRFLPRPKYFEEKEIQLSMSSWFWTMCSKIPGGFVGFFLRCMLLSSLFSGKKTLSPLSLPVARGVFSDLWPSMFPSSFIVLSSCGAVSTGPEDTSEVTLVALVDGVWTPTSHYVTIPQLSDLVVKVPPTHSSIVLNPLSASSEDLSCLAYFYVVAFVYCQRGCIIPSCLCIEED